MLEDSSGVAEHAGDRATGDVPKSSMWANAGMIIENPKQQNLKDAAMLEPTQGTQEIDGRHRCDGDGEDEEKDGDENGGEGPEEEKDEDDNKDEVEDMHQEAAWTDATLLAAAALFVLNRVDNTDFYTHILNIDSTAFAQQRTFSDEERLLLGRAAKATFLTKLNASEHGCTART